MRLIAEELERMAVVLDTETNGPGPALFVRIAADRMLRCERMYFALCDLHQSLTFAEKESRIGRAIHEARDMICD